MTTWGAHNDYPATERRDITAAPLLDFLVVVAMLIIGCLGYQAVTAARNGYASNGLSSEPMALRAAVTAAELAIQIKADLESISEAR